MCGCKGGQNSSQFRHEVLGNRGFSDSSASVFERMNERRISRQTTKIGQRKRTGLEGFRIPHVCSSDRGRSFTAGSLSPSSNYVVNVAVQQSRSLAHIIKLVVDCLGCESRREIPCESIVGSRSYPSVRAKQRKSRQDVPTLTSGKKVLSREALGDGHNGTHIRVMNFF